MTGRSGSGLAGSSIPNRVIVGAASEKDEHTGKYNINCKNYHYISILTTAKKNFKMWNKYLALSLISILSNSKCVIFITVEIRYYYFGLNLAKAAFGKNKLNCPRLNWHFCVISCSLLSFQNCSRIISKTFATAGNLKRPRMAFIAS